MVSCSPALPLALLSDAGGCGSVRQWNALIRTNAAHAVEIFNLLLRRRSALLPDNFTFTFLLRCPRSVRLVPVLHSQVVRRGFAEDVFVATSLVSSYSQRSLPDARRVFDGMAYRDTSAWNAMLGALARCAPPRDAIALFREMAHVDSVLPDAVSVISLLPAICRTCSLALCRAVHSFAVKRFDTLSVSSVYNAMVDAYSKCRRPDMARKVFDSLVSCGMDDTVSWGTMASGFVHSGWYPSALELFDELMLLRRQANWVVVVSALSAAAEMADFRRGVAIHDYAVQEEVDTDVAVATTLITMYGKFGDMENAKSVFDGMQERDLVAWSAMISAYVQCGDPEEALSLFLEMQLSGIVPGVVSLVGALTACAELEYLRQGKSIHCFSLRSDTVMNAHLANALIAMYSKCQAFQEAHTLFDQLDCKDVIMWNAIINAYAQIGEAEKALQMFQQLRSAGLKPDSGTMVGVLPSFAILNAHCQGACSHGMIIKYGFLTDRHVKNAAIGMYSKCQDLPSAERVFHETKSSGDVVSWSTMISGYKDNGLPAEAIRAFHQMRSAGVSPNVVSLVSVIPAIAYLSNLRAGLAFHSFVSTSGYVSHLTVGNSLIDMYSKCGRLDHARQIFNEMRFQSTVTWNVMLTGYAIHGQFNNAFSFFALMSDGDLNPDAGTFLALLLACRHGGSVEHARNIFELMKHKHRIVPNLEHYACMVDILGCSGKLDEAWSLIQQMSMMPDAGIWGAFLGACKMHSETKMGEVALQHLINLEPENVANYVSLSNIYSQAERWSDAGNMRVALEFGSLNKNPGSSWSDPIFAACQTNECY